MSTRTAKNVETLIDAIEKALPENNAGLIGAEDIRENLIDVVYSIPYIVASGDWNQTGTEFISDVHLITDNTGTTGGILQVASGVRFPDGVLQTVAYQGPGTIDHGTGMVASSLLDDDHPQYINVTGIRSMEGHFGLGDDSTNTGMSHRIGAKNNTDSASGHGIHFEYVDANEEVLHVGDKTKVEFDKDNSSFDSAKSTALAWISFNSVDGGTEATTVTVNSSYNISAIKRQTSDGTSTGTPLTGKFEIYFKPGLFDNADTTGSGICAIGSSNGRNDNSTSSDINADVNVACVVRNNNMVTFTVISESAYVDATVNDLLVFGNASGVTPDTGPTVGYVGS